MKSNTATASKKSIPSKGATVNKKNNNEQQQQNGASAETTQQQESYLEKFFTAQLKDIYYAEKKITSSLPKMIEAATNEELKEAFEDHLHQTQKHIKRLEKVFEAIGKNPEAEKCEAIEGLIKEAEKIISETKEGSATRDAALIMAAQKVEHYEIATYGGLVQFALTAELNDVADILERTLIEEEDTDQLLTDIAEEHINLDAENENGYSWENNNKENKKG